MLSCGRTTPQHYPEWGGFSRQREREWVTGGEIAVTSKEELQAAPLSGKRLLGFLECTARCREAEKIGDRAERVAPSSSWPSRGLRLSAKPLIRNCHSASNVATGSMARSAGPRRYWVRRAARRRRRESPRADRRGRAGARLIGPSVLAGYTARPATSGAGSAR